jgi:uncharacterized SAM-binding protein YcdF (DUF218 family)
MKLHHQHKYRFFGLAIASWVALLLDMIRMRGAIAHYQAPVPQAVLTLGGDENREVFTAQFAQTHPHLEIWVSSGIDPHKARQIFATAGIPAKRVHLDRRAADTVTNFTSLVSDFKSRRIQHLYLITSDFHMPRAKAIATFIFGSQGIAFTPVSIPTNQPTESLPHILRDTGRAILWLFTGRTGASLNPQKDFISAV